MFAEILATSRFRICNFFSKSVDKKWGNILKKRGQYSKILSSEEVEAEARNGAKRNVGPKPQPSRRIIFLNIVRVF